MTPVISVIVPCYNQGSFIDEAVDSVLEQTFKDFEIIIINDGSTDELTISKLKNYNKPFCKVIHTENRGLAAARNEGIRQAKGKYLQFLDADDIIRKEKFALQLSELEFATENSLCYCDYFPSTETDPNEECPSRYMSPVFKTENYLREIILDWERGISIPCHCFLFNGSVFRAGKIFFSEILPNHEDWDCWLKVFRNKPEVHFINKKLVVYRIRSGAMSYDKKKMRDGFLMAIDKQAATFPEKGEEFKILTIRKNQVRFGYGSANSSYSFIIGKIIKMKRKAGKVFHIILNR